MTTITVSEHLAVEYSSLQWRLIRISDREEQKAKVTVEAGGGFCYSSLFASMRDLPDEGEIAADDITAVTLGWSYKTDAWQLSIVLSPDMVAARSSRRCEVLRFWDPDRSVYKQDAKNVGLALARVLGNKPFVTKPPEEAPPPEPIPLADLPLEVGIWRLQPGAAPGELRFLRSTSWMRAKMRQIAWYVLLAVLYAWVAAASMSSELALPNTGTLIPDPQILPYLGIGAAILLILLIGQQIRHILRQPDTILISSYERSIIARRGHKVCWKVNANGVQSVYASELVKKRGRRPTVYHSEINLHLVNGRFRPVIVEDGKLTNALLPGADRYTKKNRAVGVTILEPQEVSTTLQAAAIHISVCLDGLPVRYDRRYK